MIKTGCKTSKAPVNRVEVWIISANPALVEKIEKVLRPLTRRIQVLPPALAGEGLEDKLRGGAPGLIVIDLGADMDWGMGVLRDIKQASSQIPTVVLTEEFSREFGAKILSEGVSYYFPHDFAETEFERLARSLLINVKKNTQGM